MDALFGPYRLMRNERQVLGPDGPLNLSARSFDILAILLDRPDTVIGKDELFDLIWPGLVVEENTLQVHISSLRKQLAPGMIVTVHGRGYKYGGPAPITPGAAPTGAPSRRPVIAVLPFDNQSGDPGQDYLSDGITQDITDRLTRFRMFSIVGVHSAFAFRGNTMDFAGIRNSLRADFVVTGSVRRSGERVRITARLSDIRNEIAVWAENFEGAALDIFSLQDEAVWAIVNTIEGRALASAAASARSKPLASWNAYDCLLQGRELCNGGREPDAIPLFARAVAIDPSFTLGHAWLSLAQTVAYENTAQLELLTSAYSNAERAVQLDYNEPVSHWAAAMAALFGRQHSEAGRHFEHAMRLNPADVQIRADHAQWLRCTGQYHAGLEAIETALEHGPFSPPWFWGMRGEILFDLERYDEAQASIVKVAEKKSRLIFFLAATQAQLGRMDLAQETTREIHRRWPKVRLSELPFVNPTACEGSAENLLSGLRSAGLPE